MSRSTRAVVPARWRSVVVVCGKCSRKIGGGFGPKGRTSLAKLLRRAAEGKGRKAGFGVVEAGCLKLCPKDAVVAIDAQRPGIWHLVRPGCTLEQVTELLDLRAPENRADAVAPARASGL